MGSLFSLSRSLFHSHRMMPVNGVAEFKTLKKKYGKGQELRGKTIGIVGFGRIGRSLASYCFGIGMKVVAIDMQSNPVKIPLHINGTADLNITLTPETNLNDVIGDLDYISLHVPKQANGSAVIGDSEIEKMKDGVVLVNAARGGLIDEDALLRGLNSGKIRGCALDVYENKSTLGVGSFS